MYSICFSKIWISRSVFEAIIINPIINADNIIPKMIAKTTKTVKQYVPQHDPQHAVYFSLSSSLLYSSLSFYLEINYSLSSLSVFYILFYIIIKL